MTGGGLKPPTAIEEGKSDTSGSQNQPPADLNKLLGELMEKGSSQGGDGQEGVGKGGGSNPQKTASSAPLSEEDKKQQEKKAELEARLREIIARYKRIQEEIRAYQKRKEKEEAEKKRVEEEEEKKRKKQKEEAEHQKKVALPASPKKGFMANFLKKLSSGGEQGRLKE